mgnify:FL=1
MNREIKFRAQRTDTKEFVYGYYHEVEAEGVGYSYIFWQGNTIPVRADSVGQFTGKLDDNRKEIFEGDIVVDIIGKHYSVEWNDDTCKYQLSDGSDLNDNDRYGTYLVVIGNIYENKKLIN